MKVFIGWSGEVSRFVATALHDWLPLVDQNLEPWMSEHDIEKGQPWRDEIGKILDEAKGGILCITADNLSSSWIHYEAGNLVGKGKSVFPYAYNFRNASDVPEPLGSLQVTVANEADTKQLILSLAKLHGGKPELIAHAFEKEWGDFSDKLKNAPTKKPTPKTRTDTEKIDEILEHVRGLKIDEILDHVRELRLPTVLRGPSLLGGSFLPDVLGGRFEPTTLERGQKNVIAALKDVKGGEDLLADLPSPKVT